MRRTLLPAILFLGAASCGSPAPPASPAPASAAPPLSAPISSWIARSDENARLLVDEDARFYPEGASGLGVEAADELTRDLAPGHRAREVAALREVAKAL